MLLYNASTFAAQISNEFFYNQFYTETGIGSRVSQNSKYDIQGFDFWLKNKINIDKIRYEYGGCIYAGWVISCIELLVCPLVWYYRGFS